MYSNQVSINCCRKSKRSKTVSHDQYQMTECFQIDPATGEAKMFEEGTQYT